MNFVFIYSLHDPGTGHLRYVGWANNIKKRLAAHLSKARAVKDTSHRTNWIRKLLSEGKEPLQFLVAEVPKVEGAPPEEIFFIKRARELGFDLVNGSDGGEGGINPTESVRAKISFANSHPSDETRARKSAAKSGANHPAFGKPAHNRGVSPSEETRVKIRVARALQVMRIGWKHSPETIEKFKASHSNMTEETRAKMSAAKSGIKRGPYKKRSPDAS